MHDSKKFEDQPEYSLQSSTTMQRKSSSKLDKIADHIIRTVAIKGQQRFIDQDIPEDNISYDESEKRRSRL